MDREIQNRSLKVMKKGGRLVSTNAAPNKMLADKYDVNIFSVTRSTDGNVLTKIGKLLENKQIISVVEKTFNLSEVKEAHKLIETGHSCGKIVLKV